MATERRRSFGSVTYLGKDREGAGRWRLRYPKGGSRKTEVVHGTKRDAEHRLAQLHVEAGAERQSRITVGQAYERWWRPEKAASVAELTLKAYDSAWKSAIAPRWADVPVAAVRPIDVQGWLSGLAPMMALRAKGVLKGVLDKCVLYEVVPSNPAAGRFAMPSSSDKAIDKGVYGLDGLRRAWEAVKGTHIEAAVLLMGFAGTRVGESLAVRPSEPYVSGDVCAVPVVRQMGNQGRVVDALKNEQSRRVAVLPGPMGRRMAELCGAGGDWLCDSGVGRPATQAEARAVWDRALAEAGVEWHPLRNLRNSWETVARWELGLDPLVIEKLLGHVGKGVTARHYDRPIEEMCINAVSRAYAANPFADDWDI